MVPCAEEGWTRYQGLIDLSGPSRLHRKGPDPDYAKELSRAQQIRVLAVLNDATVNQSSKLLCMLTLVKSTGDKKLQAIYDRCRLRQHKEPELRSLAEEFTAAYCSID